MNSLTSKTTLKRIFLSITIVLLVIINVNCSSAGDLSDPVTPEPELKGIEFSETLPDDMIMYGAYKVEIDPGAREISIAPSREIESTYNIGFFIDPAYINATITDIDLANEYVEFEYEITNPFNIDVYDVRILLLPYYTDSSELLNVDDYSRHFNQFSVNEINPFKAYCRGVVNRKFGAGTTHHDVFQVQGTPLIFTLLIEGSLPDVTEEPIEITGQSCTNPVTSLTGAVVETHAFDHQNNIDLVSVDTTAINGTITNFVNTWGDYYESAVIYNTVGASPGTYTCLISASSPGTSWDLYDYIEIEVGPEPWAKADYPLTTDSCSMDIGVIGDQGGTRDSQIITADTAMWGCDMITAYYPYYSGTYDYVAGLTGLDPTNDQYDPWPVRRIDAANSGAFSITNSNQDIFTQIAGVDYYNFQVWSVFDDNLTVKTGPSPDSSRYMNILAPWQTAQSYPIDVCDDFDGGQYALFTTGAMSTGKDLVLCGTMPDTYTHDMVKYMGNLDGYCGNGPGLVNPSKIAGIDVYVVDREEYFAAVVFILEKTATSLQVEVFSVSNTAAGWGWDFVEQILTIDINPDNPLKPDDIELLPPTEEYDLNPSANFPTVCILATEGSNPNTYGHVLLFNGYTGAFLEDLASYFGPDPLFKDDKLCFLDTDDGDFEIHVTRFDENDNPWATVFSPL